ncbi:hypothetical protein GXW83_22005 [Streptacidiphilus sp. PB12-B1b]|uniref:hypothetical protein n=1 Tax=Streptacidiphilus sp. PB12-B1b TaxID=2705012 RepID=UPI0015FB3DEF|nr:hypothetical protein [Streptacidiphilus sp. PB12-B1b]QMU77971.1 hypothetical protein GXW83_22005 [Streptacidiphilus sp. PB12-B1b]
MLSSTTLAVAGMFWASMGHSRERRDLERRVSEIQLEVRGELAEVNARVVAIQRLLEDAVD